MVEPATSKGFPRFRVFWRVYYSAQEILGLLPLVILTPTVGAFLGTAGAVSHPSFGRPSRPCGGRPLNRRCAP
jgi:hypothetical protein